MPDYNPTITTQVNPIVSAVTGGAVSYEEINQSIGTFIYQLESLYVYTPSNISQLLRPIYLRKYNKAGDRSERYLFMTIDPFQLVAALQVDFQELDYRFDSNNNFYIDIEPNTTLVMKITIKEMSPNNFFPEPEEDNFEDIEMLTDYIIDF